MLQSRNSVLCASLCRPVQAVVATVKRKYNFWVWLSLINVIYQAERMHNKFSISVNLVCINFVDCSTRVSWNTRNILTSLSASLRYIIISIDTAYAKEERAAKQPLFCYMWLHYVCFENCWKLLAEQLLVLQICVLHYALVERSLTSALCANSLSIASALNMFKEKKKWLSAVVRTSIRLRRSLSTIIAKQFNCIPRSRVPAPRVI